jgi:hypothetical protein
MAGPAVTSCRIAPSAHDSMPKSIKIRSSNNNKTKTKTKAIIASSLSSSPDNNEINNPEDKGNSNKVNSSKVNSNRNSIMRPPSPPIKYQLAARDKDKNKRRHSFVRSFVCVMFIRFFVWDRRCCFNEDTVRTSFCLSFFVAPK